MDTTIEMDESLGRWEIPAYRRLPVEIRSASGVVLETTDGRRLIDFYGGHAAALLGYGHPRLTRALAEQAQRLFFQSNAVEVEVRRRAARRLAGIAPAGLDRVLFVNSGAEANENALRIAFRATGRSHVVALRGSFHGRTAAAAAVTDGAARWYAFPRTPFDVSFVEPEDGNALAAAVTGDTAAIIVEPVQGMAGAREVSDSFLREMRRIATDRGALLIADEVQCGMGRSGRFFAIERSGVAADIITAAKGIAGGFPCGAVICRRDLAEVIGPGDLGTTFGGGPLACALVETVIDVLEEPGFLGHVIAMEQVIRASCGGGPVREIHGRGLLLGLRVDAPAVEILERLLKRGILAGGARDPHVIRLLPPLIIDADEVHTLVVALEAEN